MYCQPTAASQCTLDDPNTVEICFGLAQSKKFVWFVDSENRWWFSSQLKYMASMQLKYGKNTVSTVNRVCVAFRDCDLK